MSSVSSRLCADAYLVAQALAGNDSNLIADALVGLEVESETRVVALNDDLGRLLDSLSPDATHFDRCEAVVSIGGGLVVLGVKSAVAAVYLRTKLEVATRQAQILSQPTQHRDTCDGMPKASSDLIRSCNVW